MRYNIEIRALAAMEIIEAYDWYEYQRSGLGIEFLDELDAFYNKLLDNPLLHSYYSAQIREGKIYRFPYLVVYEVFDDTIVIYSVFMSKQDPDKKKPQ